MINFAQNPMDFYHKHYLTLPLTSLSGYGVSMQVAAKIGMKWLALSRAHSGFIVTLLLVLIPLNTKQKALTVLE